MASDFLKQRVLLAAILEQTELLFELMAENQVNAAYQVSVWRDELLARVDVGNLDS